MFSLSNEELEIVLDAQVRIVQERIERRQPVAEALANAARIAPPRIAKLRLAGFDTLELLWPPQLRHLPRPRQPSRCW